MHAEDAADDDVLATVDGDPEVRVASAVAGGHHGEVGDRLARRPHAIELIRQPADLSSVSAAVERA